jgi:flagellar biosynthesis/type III secretory pathway protein FliH
MSATFTVNLDKPVTSVEILSAEDTKHAEQELSAGHPTVECSSAASAARIMQDLEKQKAETAQLYRTLSSLVGELSKFYEELLARHREEIAKLSVEIARKILMQKVQKADYQIEAIVKEALRNAPMRQNVVVHLNPADLTQLQNVPDGRWMMDDSAGIEFIADPAIGQAECLVETPKGIIKSLIDEHLARISEALGLAVAGTATDPAINCGAK